MVVAADKTEQHGEFKSRDGDRKMQMKCARKTRHQRKHLNANLLGPTGLDRHKKLDDAKSTGRSNIKSIDYVINIVTSKYFC